MMLSRGMQKGALITREAHLALLNLKSLIERAAEKTRAAGFETAGMAVSPHPTGDPLRTLKVAADTLRSEDFESALAEAKKKVEDALAWHERQQVLL
jgi:hypothetical protein